MVDVKDGTVIMVVEEGNTWGIVKGGIVMAGVNGGIVIVGVTSITVMAGVIGGKMTSNCPFGLILFILSRLKNSFKLFNDCSILTWVSEISSIFSFTLSTSWLKFLLCMASSSILACDLVL